MSNGIINATPLVRNLGIKDDSTRPAVREPESLPTHLPKIYVWAQKGPSTPQLVVGGSRDELFGVDSFDLKKKWANHATVLSNVVNARANSQMLQRLIPADAKSACMRVSLEISKNTVTLKDLKRSANGMAVGGSDKYEASATTEGSYVARVVLEACDNFGKGTQGKGSKFASGDAGVTAEVTDVDKYPLFDVKVASPGEYGNNCGLSLVPYKTANGSVGANVLKEQNAFPYRLIVKERANINENFTFVPTLKGDREILVSFKPDTVNELTGDSVYFGDGFLPHYESLGVPNMSDVYGLFGEVHVYEDHVKTVSDLVFAAEKKALNDKKAAVTNYKSSLDLFPVVADPSLELNYAVNLLTGVNSSGVPYFAYRMGEGSEALTEDKVLVAQGGSDGTMNEASYSSLVVADIANYGDPLHEYQDTAKYPESIYYDTGIAKEQKAKLVKFIQQRHDTVLVLSTFDAALHSDGKNLYTAETEQSEGRNLQLALKNAPESSYFGTSVARGIIMTRCGKLLNSPFKKYLPLTIEFADKCAAYMGAGDGVWNPSYAFDKYPGNLVTMFTNINAIYSNPTVRNDNWVSGLNWVQSFDRSSYFWPAFKTVYSNDTSVLTSVFTMFACVEIQKVHERVWRLFTGRSDLSNGQLTNAVDKAISSMVLNRFDGRFVIEPKSIVTEADKQRGYSWTTQTVIYASNMKTVGTFSISTRRLDDRK